jgi:HAMP domain-containing protein
MKKVKIAFWVIVFGFLALVIYQNQDFFLAKRSLGVNLYFTAYTSPEVHNAIFFLVFFFAGLLITYVFSLFSQFKAGKTIKSLNASLKSNSEELSRLRSEVAALQSSNTPTMQAPPAQAPAEETTMEEPATVKEPAQEIPTASAEKSN